MREMIAAIGGGAVVLLIVAFVLAYQANARKDAALTNAKMKLVEAAAQAQHATELRDNALDARDAAIAARDTAISQRDFAMEQNRLDRSTIGELKRQMENLSHAKNLLHRDSLEDMQANDVAIALHVREMRARADTIELLLTKKGKVKK